MTAVVDASVAIRWSLEGAGSDRAEALLMSGERLIGPDLVIVEVTNAAWKAVAFGGLPGRQAAEIASEAAGYFDELVPAAVLSDRALDIAIELRHPVYDCFYLALAEQRDCRLVTADDRLIRRCAGTPHAGRIGAL